MKILHIITRFNSGGTATWLNQLMDGDVFEGDENYLSFGRCSRSEIEAIPRQKFRVIRIKNLQRQISPWRDVKALFELMNLIRKLNPDVVNTHTFKAGTVGRVAVKFSGKKSIIMVHTVHGHLKYGYFNPLVSKVILTVERFMERLTDGFIVAGHKLLQELQDENLLRNSIVKVILPGFRSSRTKSGHVAEEKIKVGWLGRLTQIKRPDRVVQIARLLPNIDFFMGGSGELENEVTQYSPKNLHFVGWVDPNEFWSDKDIGLLTSDNEATPYAIIEGNMNGIPFVATRVGSVEDVVVNEVNGFLTKQNSQEMANRIGVLAENSELRTQMGRQALNLAEEKFGVARFQEEHRDFYRRLMDE
jgi:glycosyltransferase involved in cell wall biosynthesis